MAKGISEQIIKLLKKHLQEETVVPDALHQRLRGLFLQYTVVGGMPDVVQTFKLGDYNVGRFEQILTLPLYMAFLLNET